MYRLETPGEKVNLAGHVGGTAKFEFDRDGSTLTSIGNDRLIKFWDTRTGRTIRQSGPFRLPGNSFSFSPDGRFLATSAQSAHRVDLFDAPSSKPLLELDAQEGGFTWCVRFSGNGRALLTASSFGTNTGLRVWQRKASGTDGSEFALEPQPAKFFPGFIWSLVLAPDGDHFAFVEDKSATIKVVYLWSVTIPGTPRSLWTNSLPSTQNHSFTPDGKALLTIDDRRSIVTLDLQGRIISSFPTLAASNLPEAVEGFALSLSPDGTKVALTSPSGQAVQFWERHTGQLLFSLPERMSSLGWLAWAPDSERIAVSWSSGVIEIWDLAEIKRVVGDLGLSARRLQKVPVR
jgi:WD40 repeat protein